MQVQRPPDWGGYAVRPHRMEFLTFSDSRLHERLLYIRDVEGWHVTQLSP
jgi:pyridoxamine 5'-phosphate oxidase